MKRKNVVTRISLLLGYIIILAPMLFSIYNSVPLGDDFASATRQNGQSLLSQACRFGFGMWRTWGGRWLDYIIQVFFNPLNSHTHLGRSYGIILIGYFLVCTVILICSLRVVVSEVVSKYVDLVTFLVMALVYTSYYYSECYNWYVGYWAYTIPITLTLATIALMIKYANTNQTKYYVLMIIAGIVPAVNEFCDVALGVSYLYYIYYKNKDERLSEATKLKIKNIIPLIVYIVFGASVVFAPGNYVRRDYYGVHSSVVLSTKQLIIDIIIRVQDLIVDHPLAVLIFLVLIFVGVIAGGELKSAPSIWAPIVVMALITFGSVFPYLYGRAFDTTYLDVRMQFVLDLCIEFSMAVLCLLIGELLAVKLELKLDKKEIFRVVCILILFSYVSIIQNYAYLNIVQVDILRSSGLIKESYALWDGILAEIEQSEDEDVVLYRDTELNWTPYFLYTGLTHGEKFSVDYDKIYDEDQIMPNVYYEKKSITLYYRDQME